MPVNVDPAIVCFCILFLRTNKCSEEKSLWVQVYLDIEYEC